MISLPGKLFSDISDIPITYCCKILSLLRKEKNPSHLCIEKKCVEKEGKWKNTGVD
jgi:hypothetical protein